MEAVVEVSRVARKGQRGGPRPGAGRPKASGRDDVTVKLDRSLVARARFVADLRGISLAEYLTDAVRPAVDRDFEKAARTSPEK